MGVNAYHAKCGELSKLYCRYMRKYLKWRYHILNATLRVFNHKDKKWKGAGEAGGVSESGMCSPHTTK